MMISKPPPIDIFSPSNVEFVATRDSLKGAKIIANKLIKFGSI